MIWAGVHLYVCTSCIRECQTCGSTPTNTSCFSRIKQVYRTQTLTSTEHHFPGILSHFWVQLSGRNPFLPPNKNGKFLRFFITLYVRLQHAVPPTNTKFKLLLLPTQAGIPFTNTHKHRTSYFKSTLSAESPFLPTKKKNTGNSCGSSS